MLSDQEGQGSEERPAGGRSADTSKVSCAGVLASSSRCGTASGLRGGISGSVS